MKSALIILTCLILGSLLLPACAGGPQLAVELSFQEVEGGREVAVTVTVSDESGLPLEGAEVAYEQISQDFMYNVGEYWDPGSLEAGSNTAGIYLDHEWWLLEPQDDVYDWDGLEMIGELNSDGELLTGAEHVFLRLGVISTCASVVGEGMDTFTETGYPEWIDQNDLEQAKSEYLEFVAALLGHLKFRPDFYMIELEINSLGPNTGMTNEEIIDWLGQLTSVIKEADADAKIAVTVAAQDLSPFMDWGREINPELVAQDRYQLPVTEFLERAERIDYDIIAVIIQPFGWFSKGDWEDARGFLESLERFDRDIYIGWIGFLAEEPVVPAALDPNPNNINGEGGFPYYPNPEGHSQEWQREQSLALMDYIISNPRISGVHWDLLDFIEPEVGGLDYDVKLTTGFTTGYRDEDNEIIAGEERLVHEAMRQLWLSLFSQGTVTTDAAGEATFSGWAGSYELTVSYPDYDEEKLIVHVR
ncbi:MAG: hypothetical protein PVJ81_00375 [Dehalococcoidia bacterium]|jgi:hypothetical protein